MTAYQWSYINVRHAISNVKTYNLAAKINVTFGSITLAPVCVYTWHSKPTT